MDAPATVPHAQRNWWMHAIEGGLFIGAMAIVSAQTLLPTVVSRLGGAEWLVALMPVLMTIGFHLVPIFTAHAIGRLGRFHPLLLVTGVPQRLPYLVAGLVLLLWPERTALCLGAVALAPLVSGCCGGLTATGWQQLVARTVPSQRRSSLFAVRFAIGALMGVAAGGVVERILAAHPGTVGYGLLHLAAFAVLMLSYAFFAAIREPAEAQATEPPTGMWTNVRGLPTLVARDARLRRWLATVAIFNLAGMAVPYFGIHALQTSGRPESFLGSLIAWQMGGSVLGGLLAGGIGDRAGARIVLIAARLGYVALCLLAPFAVSGVVWCALFALFGAATTAFGVAGSALQLDLLPARNRANQLAVMMAAQLPVMVGAGLAGGGLWHAFGDEAFPLLAGAGAALGLASLPPLLRIPEPRRLAARAA